MKRTPDSLYDIPEGCICMGDGLMGMKCEAKDHARLKEPMKWLSDLEALEKALDAEHRAQAALAFANPDLFNACGFDGEELDGARNFLPRLIAIAKAAGQVAAEDWGTSCSENCHYGRIAKMDALRAALEASE